MSRIIIYKSWAYHVRTKKPVYNIELQQRSYCAVIPGSGRVVIQMIGLKASLLAVITLSIYLAANTEAGIQMQDMKKSVIECFQQN